MSNAGFNELNDDARENHAALAAEISRLQSGGDSAGALEALDRLMDEPDLLSLDTTIKIMNHAPDGSALQQKAAANLLTLSFNLEQSPYRAAQTCWLAAEKLPPQSLPGQAALDRVLDIADKDIERNELTLMFLRMAAARAVPDSDLAVRGRDLWLTHLGGLDEKLKMDELRVAAWQSSAGSELQETALSLWSAVVREYIEYNRLDEALAETEKVLAHPDTKSAMEQEAIEMWKTSVERVAQENPNKALLKACQISDRLYVDENPLEYTAIKEAAAETLLKLSRETGNPKLIYQAVSRAAKYAGGNPDLHSRIAHALILIVHGSPKPAHRQEANTMLDRHLKYGRADGDAPSLTVF